MGQSYLIVDAFSASPFKGNPAAVCRLESPLSESRMQLIASEINLSETAFVLSQGESYGLRWFTPTAEVRLCGHATLASAHALWSAYGAQADLLRFNTLSGELTARRVEQGIELDFPVEDVVTSEWPSELHKAIGVTPTFCGWTGVRYFAELPSADLVRNVRPNIELLRSVPPGRLIVTARSDDPRYDFVSRYFAPGVGIPEDPVTGSAHCALAAYWGERLGKTQFRAYQASARGGELLVRLESKRVKLIGSAVTVARGEFCV